MNEHLNNAQTAAEIAVRHLRDALAKASAVESIVLLALIERAAALARDIYALDTACCQDGHA
jgi:hypothetical protein